MRLLKYFKNRIKLKYSDFFFVESKKKLLDSVIKTIRIESTESTLNEIYILIEKNKPGAYMRFGDGDVYLMLNRNDAYQQSSPALSEEMRESFLISQNNVLKSLAIHSNLFGYEPKMFEGNHKNNDNLAYYLVLTTFEFFIGQKIYSPIALHHQASINPSGANHFLKLLKDKVGVFVGNENIDKKTFEKLFGDAAYIRVPERNAYAKLDEAIEQCVCILDKLEDFTVVVVAMGCSGRILMKRILDLNKNVFLFDFGSLLDGIGGNKTRTWLKVTDINYESLLKDL